MRAEVAGLHEQECVSVDELMHFFSMCFENRSTGSTNLNATSSRSHALFTINVHRVIVSVGDGVDEHLKARVRTEGIESKLHLVDLAGSERVKRSGVEGKHFKEATKINGGLLALGNVIVALADGSPHIPYRTSKLTRLIQVRLCKCGRLSARVCVHLYLQPTERAHLVAVRSAIVLSCHRRRPLHCRHNGAAAYALAAPQPCCNA